MSRPIAHVAAEMGIRVASKWVNQHRHYGAPNPHEHSSTPHHNPRATSGETVATIETWRRHTWSASAPPPN
ncbi:hypothetical protein [Halostreptopolyspora alba]|uniref:hypothetical protein n=1 Tax=Halostreptopolyspora alba TaxID=2487137 RepID=UPI002699BE4E